MRLRLLDLDASFLRLLTEVPKTWRRVDTLVEAQGLWFQCPLCAEGLEFGEENGRRFAKGAHGVLCWFRNPPALPAVPDELAPGPGRWWVEGTDLSNLTFGHGEPHRPKSIQLTGGCNWHGYLESGYVW